MQRKLLIIILVLMPFLSSVAQDSSYARRVISVLSSEQMQGRGSAYRGDSIAASYIRQELRRFKVKPLGNNYFQSFTYPTFSMEGQCWMEVDGKRLKSFDEFRVMPWSAGIFHPSIDIVTIPLKTFLDRKKLQQYIAKHQGVINNAFIYIDASGLSLLPADVQQRAQMELARLRKRNPFTSRGIILGLEQMNPFSLSDCDQPKGYALIEVLASAMPAKPSHLNIHINTQYRPSYKTQNVCGMIEGLSDSIIVLCAHYDHLGLMGDGYKYMVGNEVFQKDKVLFPGAHDNASGVAALLDIARMFSYEKPRYTLFFIFFAGEEAGLKGSTYAAEHPLIDYGNVKLLINLDLFCGGDEGLMVFNAKSAETQPYYNRLKTLNDVLQVAPEIRPRDNAPNSDHYPFSSLCPSIYILTMGHPYGGYHDPADRCEACGLEHYYNYLLLISSLLM